MENKKIISLLILLSFLMSATAAPGRSFLDTDIPAERTKSIHTFELNRKSIFVAENEPQASENGSQSTTENKDQSLDSGTADKKQSGKNADDAETKPIKPFKPSEEIAAEQAVDYPVDI